RRAPPRRRDVGLVGLLGHSEALARRAQPEAVADLDRLQPGVVERGDELRRVLGAELEVDRVGAVAEGVLDDLYRPLVRHAPSSIAASKPRKSYGISPAATRSNQ